MEIMRDIYTCTIYLIILISGKNDLFSSFSSLIIEMC